MNRIIAIANQKGGVGKTTTAVSLAHGLALRRRNVLLVDLDPQGQCATSLAVNPEPGVFNALVNPRSDIRQWIRDTGREYLHLLPGDRSTATAQIVINAENRPIDAILSLLRVLRNEYDYILLDTAPSVGGIQERAVYASDLTLIPTATEFLSMDGLVQMTDLLGSLRERFHWNGRLLGILPTFYDEQTSESAKSIEELRGKFGKGILSPIHRATVLRECAADGVTIFEKAPASRASQEY
ncbi:MAG: ParA family protein [Bryobacterales bacterium]|nr:ParA family protein [Bryobacterales bacterium]WKZ50255.1 MAG: ParA family protein [Anaerolineales bacterium]